jgi:hypothetical protein
MVQSEGSTTIIRRAGFICVLAAGNPEERRYLQLMFDLLAC